MSMPGVGCTGWCPGPRNPASVTQRPVSARPSGSGCGEPVTPTAHPPPQPAFFPPAQGTVLRVSPALCRPPGLPCQSSLRAGLRPGGSGWRPWSPPPLMMGEAEGQQPTQASLHRGRRFPQRTLLRSLLLCSHDTNNDLSLMMCSVAESRGYTFW